MYIKIIFISKNCDLSCCHFTTAIGAVGYNNGKMQSVFFYCTTFWIDKWLPYMKLCYLSEIQVQQSNVCSSTMPLLRIFLKSIFQFEWWDSASHVLVWLTEYEIFQKVSWLISIYLAMYYFISFKHCCLTDVYSISDDCLCQIFDWYRRFIKLLASVISIPYVKHHDSGIKNLHNM